MAICAGCGKADHEFPVYSEEGNAVEHDGTYAAGVFVCDVCYLKLEMIDHALSVGQAEAIQANALIHIRSKP